jgi:hypothetical protein
VTRHPFGAEIDPDIAEAIIDAEPNEMLGVVKARALGKHGSNQHTSEHDNVMSSSITHQGNSRIYTLARLDRDRPDLAAKVRTKEISANAAAIKAGFRKEPDRCFLGCARSVLRVVALGWPLGAPDQMRCGADLNRGIEQRSTPIARAHQNAQRVNCRVIPQQLLGPVQMPLHYRCRYRCVSHFHCHAAASL